MTVGKTLLETWEMSWSDNPARGKRLRVPEHIEDVRVTGNAPFVVLRHIEDGGLAAGRAQPRMSVEDLICSHRFVRHTADDRTPRYRTWRSGVGFGAARRRGPIVMNRHRWVSPSTLVVVWANASAHVKSCSPH
jgi:hypothetical protein